MSLSRSPAVCGGLACMYRSSSLCWVGVNQPIIRLNSVTIVSSVCVVEVFAEPHNCNCIYTTVLRKDYYFFTAFLPFAAGFSASLLWSFFLANINLPLVTGALATTSTGGKLFSTATA